MESKLTGLEKCCMNLAANFVLSNSEDRNASSRSLNVTDLQKTEGCISHAIYRKLIENRTATRNNDHLAPNDDQNASYSNDATYLVLIEDRNVSNISDGIYKEPSER